MHDRNQQPENLLFEWRWLNEIFIPQIPILRSQNDEIYTLTFHLWNAELCRFFAQMAHTQSHTTYGDHRKKGRAKMALPAQKPMFTQINSLNRFNSSNCIKYCCLLMFFCRRCLLRGSNLLNGCRRCLLSLLAAQGYYQGRHQE